MNMEDSKTAEPLAAGEACGYILTLCQVRQTEGTFVALSSQQGDAVRYLPNPHCPTAENMVGRN